MSRRAALTPEWLADGVTTGPAKGRWEVVIEGYRPTSLNKLMRMHWAKRGRILAPEAFVIYAHCRRFAVPAAAGKRRVGQLQTLAGRDKEMDPDNAFKVVLDALVKCGRLVDDSADWCEVGSVAFERGDARKTTIIIEDI